jgi:hypothetical protein
LGPSDLACCKNLSRSFQTTAAVLERIFTAWETLLLKAAAEHLIGGEHSIIEGAKEAEALSVPRHNKFPERV